MAGPPGMRAGGPPTPGMDPNSGGASTPPASSIQASRRRAYPTNHASSNSVSYSGGFDPGAQQASAYGGSGMQAPAEGQPQYFVPGASDSAQQSQGYPGMQQQPQQGAYNAAGLQNGGQSAAAAAGGVAGGAAGYPGAAGGVAGMTNQFANMGVAGYKGVSSF